LTATSAANGSQRVEEAGDGSADPRRVFQRVLFYIT